jgi:hypothetical protein
VANTNKAGKLTNGWNLTGTPTLTVTFEGPGTCNSLGLGLVQTFPTVTSFPAANGLMVNGVPLPNTPVEVPVEIPAV